MTPTAAVFPGQGAQFAGMGRDFAENSPAARQVFERANAVLGFDIAAICFSGPIDQLERTDIQQPAIFTTSAAIWEAWLAAGGADEIIAGDSGSGVGGFTAAGGLSLGEYTALYAAGAVSFEDGLRLVRRRGQLMQQAASAQPSGMVCLVGADEVVSTNICEEARQGDVLVPANFNCPGQIVIAGHKSACERALIAAEKHGCRGVALAVAGAFHTPLMQPAADALAPVLASTDFATPKFPVISNVDAGYHRDPASIRRSLALQVTHPVRWQACVQKMAAEGISRFVEFGPGRVLTGLLRKIDRKLEAMNIAAADALPSKAVID